MKKVAMVIIAVSLLAGLAVGEKTKSFCEYGTGVSERLGVGGAKWNQNWGFQPWDWYDCDASPNVGFLNENVKGVLETTTSGTPAIDGELILRLPFGGFLNLTAYDQDEPGKIVGEIKGIIDYDVDSSQYDGLFVADLNATRAVVDEDAGTITIKFGAAVTSAPGSLITITETTGKFKSIKPVGKWEFHVSGMITIAFVPDVIPDLQTNILAALGNPALLLGAEEEIVLAGSYYRNSHKKMSSVVTDADGLQSEPDNRSFDGAWVVPVPIPDLDEEGNIQFDENGIVMTTSIHNITLNRQDPAGTRFTIMLQHTQCSPDGGISPALLQLFGVDPDTALALSGLFASTEELSDHVGQAVRVSRDTLNITLMAYGTIESSRSPFEPPQLTYISVVSGELKLVDGELEFEGTDSYYLPSQDIAPHDGFPDENEEPFLSIPYSAICKRVQVIQ